MGVVYLIFFQFRSLNYYLYLGDRRPLKIRARFSISCSSPISWLITSIAIVRPPIAITEHIKEFEPSLLRNLFAI